MEKKNKIFKIVVLSVLVLLSFVSGYVGITKLSSKTEVTYALSQYGACKHNKGYIYDHIDGTNKHLKRCRECGKTIKVEDCPSLALDGDDKIDHIYYAVDYYEEGEREGVRPDVAFAQALKETGFSLRGRAKPALSAYRRKAASASRPQLPRRSNCRTGPCCPGRRRRRSGGTERTCG